MNSAAGGAAYTAAHPAPGAASGSAAAPAGGPPRAVTRLAEPGVVEQVESGVAEQVGDRRQRRDLGLLQAELDDVGGQHVGPPLVLEGDHVGLPLMRLVSGPVAVDLVQDPLHRR